MPQSIIVFSHLRWDFVFQRPQHLLTRLAQHYRVYFFEEPVAGSSYQQLQISEPAHNLRVCRPRSTIASPGFHDDQIPFLQQMLSELMEREQIHDYAVWFYSPMALPLMQDLTPSVVVYDCMDELSLFECAAPSCCSARAHCCRSRRHRLYRRPQPVPREARPPSERALLPEQRRRRALRPRLESAARMQPDSARPATAPAGLLRRASTNGSTSTSSMRSPTRIRSGRSSWSARS